MRVVKKGRPRLGILVSGRGTHLKSIHSRIKENFLEAEIAVVISDKMHCDGIQYAKSCGLKVHEYTSESDANDLIDYLRDRLEVDFLILAGFLKCLSPEIVQKFQRKIVNIHPSLLPKYGGRGFYGMRVHEAVINSADRLSGASVHFVDEEYDTGPILAQSEISVSPTDSAETLSQRISELEIELYSTCIKALIENRVKWDDDRSPIIISSISGVSDSL